MAFLGKRKWAKYHLAPAVSFFSFSRKFRRGVQQIPLARHCDNGAAAYVSKSATGVEGGETVRSPSSG
jgi:hypothetical protein